MRKPLLALATCVAAVLTVAPAVAAEPAVAASLSDECGFVRVSYPAGVTGSFTVRRDGSEVMTLSPLPGGGNFAVFARADQTVSLAGSLSGSRPHATPDGCTEPPVTVVSFDDRCQDSSAVTVRNSGPAAATGFRFVVGATVTEIASVPPGESTHVIGGLTEYGLFSVSWANSAGAMGTVATHVYSTPGDCGANKLSLTYTERCERLDLSVTNDAAGAQKVELLNGSDVVFAQWVPAGGPNVYPIPAVNGAVYQARYAGGGPIGDPRTYTTPTHCGMGGLPATGPGTQTVVWLGVVLVLAGIGVFHIARRRRMG